MCTIFEPTHTSCNGLKCLWQHTAPQTRLIILKSTLRSEVILYTSCASILYTKEILHVWRKDWNEAMGAPLINLQPMIKDVMQPCGTTENFRKCNSDHTRVYIGSYHVYISSCEWMCMHTCLWFMLCYFLKPLWVYCRLGMYNIHISINYIKHPSADIDLE